MQGGLKAVMGVLLAVVGFAGACPVSHADELSQLRAAVQALQERVEQLERQAQPAVREAAPPAATAAAPVPARVAGTGVALPDGFAWRGDLRVRNETIRDERAFAERNRTRLRVRAGFQARVNETVRTELTLSTADNANPRGANVTMTGVNSRKPIVLNTAYVEWAPLPGLAFTAGKMPRPWRQAGQSTFFGSEINFEGLAAGYARGDFSANLFYNVLEERADGADSAMAGGQLRWHPAVGNGQVTLGTGYFGFSGVRGRRPFHAGSPNGNSLTDDPALCVGGIAPCLAQDYGLVEMYAEYVLPVAGRRLSMHADHVRNVRATNGLGTAWSAGVMWGGVSEPGTWELGYFFQQIGKDALFGQYLDGAYGGGNTDVRGGVVKAGYALARNWVVNGAYFMNDVDIAAPTRGDGRASRARAYRRLQLDLNFRY